MSLWVNRVFLYAFSRWTLPILNFKRLVCVMISSCIAKPFMHVLWKFTLCSPLAALIVIRYKKPCLDICIHLQTSSGAWVMSSWDLSSKRSIFVIFPCRTVFFFFTKLYSFTAKASLFHTIKWSLKLSHVAWIMTKIVGQNHTCKFQSYLLCRSTFFLRLDKSFAPLGGFHTFALDA